MFVLFYAHHLDHKVHVPLVLIAGDWSVGPDHQSAVHLGRQVHVLTWPRKSGRGGGGDEKKGWVKWWIRREEEKCGGAYRKVF